MWKLGRTIFRIATHSRISKSNNEDMSKTEQNEDPLSLPFQQQYAQALTELFEAIAGSNPYEMLAMLSISNLAAFDGISKEHVESGILTAMHVELLQALALRYKLS